ncbi:MAG: TIGR03560 family F420-dependent LLM class oxidoreductase [Chloroflexi bacterium]|nr:TIGR03560 family F420-dependent LLM class oxidoreductase [Chloroflexota bacterium]
MGKLKFGVFLPFYAFQAKIPNEQFSLLKNIVLESEKLGYDSIWLDDHLMYNNWPILEPWTTLSALSALTSKIKLGTMVTCNAHRNPAMLAKTAATLDVLSNGRLEFGIGAGVQEAEHVAYGFDFPKLRVRMERLGEALEVITGLWTQQKATYKGKYYSLTDAVCEPKPQQKPHPPITVGGSEEKHTLKVTAKYADRFDWGFLPSVDLYKRKLGVLEHHCKAVGRDFGEIERSCWLSGQVLIAKDQNELTEKVSKLKPANMSLEDYEKSTLAGTPEEFIERLRVYKDLGVTYFMLFFADLPATDGLRLFSEAVAKKCSLEVASGDMR